MPTKNILHTLSDKLIADVVRNLPDAEREPLEAVCLGEAIVRGEILIEDSPDLPRAVRAANRKRIMAVEDPKVRAEMLNPKTPPIVVTPKQRARKSASA